LTLKIVTNYFFVNKRTFLRNFSGLCEKFRDGTSSATSAVVAGVNTDDHRYNTPSAQLVVYSTTNVVQRVARSVCDSRQL